MEPCLKSISLRGTAIFRSGGAGRARAGRSAVRYGAGTGRAGDDSVARRGLGKVTSATEKLRCVWLRIHPSSSRYCDLRTHKIPGALQSPCLATGDCDIRVTPTTPCSGSQDRMQKPRNKRAAGARKHHRWVWVASGRTRLVDCYRHPAVSRPSKALSAAFQRMVINGIHGGLPGLGITHHVSHQLLFPTRELHQSPGSVP